MHGNADCEGFRFVALFCQHLSLHTEYLPVYSDQIKSCFWMLLLMRLRLCRVPEE